VIDFNSGLKASVGEVCTIVIPVESPGGSQLHVNRLRRGRSYPSPGGYVIPALRFPRSPLTFDV
jgi:hypothetical protein